MLWTMDSTTITMDSLVHFMDGTPEIVIGPSAGSARHVIALASRRSNGIVTDAAHQAIVDDLTHSVAFNV